MPAALLGSRPLPSAAAAARSRQAPPATSSACPLAAEASALGRLSASCAASTSESRGAWLSATPSGRGRGLSCVAGAKRRKSGKGGRGGEGEGGPEVELAPVRTNFSTNLDWPEFTYDAYQLGNIMGQGSYGDVFEALDTERKMVVAVKRMTKFRDSNSVEKTLFKLSREVSLLRLMQDSPYTIHLFDALEDDYSVYIVTELCSGGDLEDLIASYDRRVVPEAVLARCVSQVLEFLQACHEQNVCFGDVKPSNFMLAEPVEEGRPLLVKAIDFGCSQRVHEGAPLQIRMGTPIFFAPEVFQKWYGVEADCWSVGVMMYLMLSGRFPFWSNDELANLMPQDVMDRVLSEEIQYPEETWEKLSPEANDLVRSLLEKDKYKRLSAAEALEHAWFQKHDNTLRLKKPPARMLNNIVSKAPEVDGDAAATKGAGAVSSKRRGAK